MAQQSRQSIARRVQVSSDIPLSNSACPQHYYLELCNEANWQILLDAFPVLAMAASITMISFVSEYNPGRSPAKAVDELSRRPPKRQNDNSLTPCHLGHDWPKRWAGGAAGLEPDGEPRLDMPESLRQLISRPPVHNFSRCCVPRPPSSRSSLAFQLKPTGHHPALAGCTRSSTTVLA